MENAQAKTIWKKHFKSRKEHFKSQKLAQTAGSQPGTKTTTSKSPKIFAKEVLERFKELESIEGDFNKLVELNKQVLMTQRSLNPW